jgi:hypothetical protein
VTGNGISKLVFTILSAVAEAERARIRERILDVKADQRSRGRYLGGTPPLGWTVENDGALREMPEQQAAIQRMLAMRRAGSSLRAIADAIKAEGFELSHVDVQKVCWLRAAGGSADRLARASAAALRPTSRLIVTNANSVSRSAGRPDRGVCSLPARTGGDAGEGGRWGSFGGRVGLAACSGRKPQSSHAFVG